MFWAVSRGFGLRPAGQEARQRGEEAGRGGRGVSGAAGRQSQICRALVARGNGECSGAIAIVWRADECMVAQRGWVAGAACVIRMGWCGQVGGTALRNTWCNCVAMYAGAWCGGIISPIIQRYFSKRVPHHLTGGVQGSLVSWVVACTAGFSAGVFVWTRGVRTMCGCACVGFENIVCGVGIDNLCFSIVFLSVFVSCVSCFAFVFF